MRQYKIITYDFKKGQIQGLLTHAETLTQAIKLVEAFRQQGQHAFYQKLQAKEGENYGK